MPFGNKKKNILRDLFSSVLSQYKKYHPSGNVKFISLSIFQSLKLRILIEKFILISPKLKFSANTLGCYGLTQPYLTLKLGYVCGNPDLNEHRGKVFEEVDRESSPLRNSLTDCSSYCHFL